MKLKLNLKLTVNQLSNNTLNENLSEEICLVYTSCGDEREAFRISEIAIKENLAACTNIGSPISSVYKWKEGIEQSQEYPVYFKTTKNKYAELEQIIKKEHSYECPCIIMLDIKGGSAEFLNWIKESVS